VSAILNSWKEIASYLGRGVRTVQRWEHDSALPVHRPKGKDRSAVLALREELDAWLHRTAVRGNGSGDGVAGRVAPDIAPVLLKLARELLAHGKRLLDLDHQRRPEAKKLVRAVREIVRDLTVMVSADNQQHLLTRKSAR
jgi:excisionase family DNA binding protein